MGETVGKEAIFSSSIQIIQLKKLVWALVNTIKLTQCVKNQFFALRAQLKSSKQSIMSKMILDSVLKVCRLREELSTWTKSPCQNKM